MLLKKLILAVLLGLPLLSISQESYRLRLELSQLDTSQRLACYHLQLSNGDTTEWLLGNSNIFIFYDFSVACFLPEQSSLILDDLIYDLNDLNRNSNKVENSGFPLPYESTLGTIRAGFSTNIEGVLMDSLGTWVSTVELCFNLLIEDITSPNTCFQADFINPEIENLLPVRDIVQKFDPDAFVSDVVRDTAFNIFPNATKTSCFILEENSIELCGDGIDNDEDGLIDCEDSTACSPAQPNFIIRGIGGCEDLPSLIEVQGVGPNAKYSIDDGVTFQADSTFVGLPIGSYEILIVKNDVINCAQVFVEEIQEEDCIETTNAQCTDGIDNDQDGLVDCADPDCQIIQPIVTSSDPNICPSLSDGMIEIDYDQSRYEVSIDSGLTFIQTNQVGNLTKGQYFIFFLDNNTGCLSEFIENPVELNAEICPDEVGLCDDGIDNDDDGLIDCEDNDCLSDMLCADLPEYFLPNAINPRSSVNGTFGVTPADNNVLNIEVLNIYDRWGSLIYQRSNTTSDDDTHRWDGTTENGIISAGVYMYFVSVSRGARKEEIYGNVTVLY